MVDGVDTFSEKIGGTIGALTLNIFFVEGATGGGNNGGELLVLPCLRPFLRFRALPPLVLPLFDFTLIFKSGDPEN